MEFSEWHRRSLKPDFNGVYPHKAYEDLLAARRWAGRFVQQYNYEHRQSAIRFVTPIDWKPLIFRQGVNRTKIFNCCELHEPIRSLWGCHLLGCEFGWDSAIEVGNAVRGLMRRSTLKLDFHKIANVRQAEKKHFVANEMTVFNMSFADHHDMQHLGI